MEQIKVSVIIPVHNGEKYLENCLDSVINQTLKDIEIICVENNSTDNSIKILQEYSKKDSRIILETETAAGAANARNKGLKTAKGEFIAFVDADDFIDSNYFEILYNLAKKQHCDISLTSLIQMFDEEGNTSIKPVGLLTETRQLKLKKECIINTGAIWNKIYKKSFLDKFDIKFPEIDSTGEDNYFTALAVIFSNKICVCDNVTYHYRQWAQAATKVSKTRKHFKIIDIYKLTDERIKKSNLNIFLKNYWLKVLNKRKNFDILECHYNSLDKAYKQEFLQEVKKAFPNLKVKEPVQDLIVSLTSFPERINTVHIAINSLIHQTIRPEKIILTLAKEEFPNREKDLSEELQQLIKTNIEILWCEDLKSYKKLIPTLENYPTKLIVSADDDIIYPKDWLEKLYNAYKQNPKLLHCHRAHRIIFDKSKHIQPYDNWIWQVRNVKPSFNNFPTSGAGVIYCADLLYKDISNSKIFEKLAPSADDMWFWAMAVLNNTKINIVKNNIANIQPIENTQELQTLWRTNVLENKNDEQLHDILKNYPQILEKLDKSYNIYNDEPFYKKIFSIRNEKTHKVIMILGFRIRIKSQKLIDKCKKTKENRE